MRQQVAQGLMDADRVAGRLSIPEAALIEYVISSVDQAPDVMPQAQDRSTPGVAALLATPEEAARALRIGRSKVYDLIRSGALVSVKIGGSRRIPVEALRRYVQSLTTAA